VFAFFHTEMKVHSPLLCDFSRALGLLTQKRFAAGGRAMCGGPFLFDKLAEIRQQSKGLAPGVQFD
jgi:hypothetical protein